MNHIKNMGVGDTLTLKTKCGEHVVVTMKRTGSLKVRFRGLLIELTVGEFQEDYIRPLGLFVP